MFCQETKPKSNMAGLKADLDSYLSGSKSTSSGKSASLSSLAQSFTFPTLKSPFSTYSSRTTDDTELLIDPTNEDGSNSSNRNSWLEDQLPSLSKKQRIFGFMTCLLLGIFCFSFSTVYIPVIVFKARKFALLFSMGSVFVMGSFSFLWGPMNHFKHMFKRDRLPFTAVYLGTLFLTLYFAMGMQNTILTTIAASFQVCALLWFVISYIPGGQTGLKFFTRICSSLCRKTVGGGSSSLPI